MLLLFQNEADLATVSRTYEASSGVATAHTSVASEEDLRNMKYNITGKNWKSELSPVYSFRYAGLWLRIHHNILCLY